MSWAAAAGGGAPSYATIEQVGIARYDYWTNPTATITFYPLGLPQTGDVVIAWCGFGSSGAPGTAPTTAGYTALYEVDSFPSLGIYYKVMGATPDTQIDFAGEGSGFIPSAGGVVVLRNVDTSVIEDGTLTSANAGSGAPNPPAHTTVTPGAWVFAVGCSGDWDSTPGDPGDGLDVQFTIGRAPGGSEVGLAVRSTMLAEAGGLDPAVWPTWNTGPWYAVTHSIRPALA